MFQILLVAHGYLATEMKNSAEMLFGKLPHVHPINFEESDGLTSLSEKIYKKMEALKCPVLIFADLFGGTPYNASCSVALQHAEVEVEVVSGMSLPLVLELAASSDKSLKESIELIPILSKEVVKIFKKHLIEDEEDL